MSVNIHKLIKWGKMILGNSPYHVNQNEGLCYSITEIKGYYNNLTEKITRFSVPDNELPITHHDNGTIQYFPIDIFQYGLAAYDLWLLNKRNSDFVKFTKSVDWAIDNQDANGAWNTFTNQNAYEPYSAMAQGEGISLLARAAVCLKDDKYTKAAEKATRFLLTHKDIGGVCEYDDDNLWLYEYTYQPLVLNGWIFASWGILDIFKLTKKNVYKHAWIKTISTIAKNLKDFDSGYWSKYNKSSDLASPFYHRLHIAQLKVLYQLTGIDTFNEYALKWEMYQKSKINFIKAYIIKGIQKIIE